jgi:hypothetical protein
MNCQKFDYNTVNELRNPERKLTYSRTKYDEVLKSHYWSCQMLSPVTVRVPLWKIESQMQKAKRLLCHKDRNLWLHCKGGSLGSLIRNN